MIKTILMVAIYMVIAPSAYSQEIGKMYFQKDYWTAFNWNAAKESTIWIDAGFKSYKSSGNNGVNYHASQRIKIDGQLFNATLAEYTNKINRADFTVLALINEADPMKGNALQECDSMGNKLNKLFAGHSKPIDNKYRFLPEYYLGHIDWQWELGQTRVTLQCTYLGSDKDYKGISIIFEGANEDNNIEPPIFLNCERSVLSDASKMTWEPAESLALKIIPKEKVVANADLYTIGKLDLISGSQLGFSMTNKNNININYMISRIDGTLTGVATEQDGRHITDFKGTCERRNPDEKKF
jgi:hypothetical protein